MHREWSCLSWFFLAFGRREIGGHIRLENDLHANEVLFELDIGEMEMVSVSESLKVEGLKVVCTVYCYAWPDREPS